MPEPSSSPPLPPKFAHKFRLNIHSIFFFKFVSFGRTIGYVPIKCRVPVSALLGFSLTPNCPSTCTLGLLLLLFVFSLIFSQKFGIIYMIIHEKILYIFEICISWLKYKLSAGRMPGCCKRLMVILSVLQIFSTARGPCIHRIGPNHRI